MNHDTLFLLLSILSALATRAAYNWGEAIGIGETTTDSAIRSQANRRATESESNTEMAKKLANHCIQPCSENN